MVGVEDRLRREFVILVKVDEGLVRRIVGEKRRSKFYDAGSCGDWIARVDANRLAISENFRFRPCGIRENGVAGGELQSVADERDELIGVLRDKRRVEQAVSGIYAQFVRDVV